MFGGWKIKRSSGVRVSARVHAAIARGNEARGRSDWGAAASFYEQALALDPSLIHIWIQIGHMFKEDRAWERAVHAYAEAAKLAPTDPDVIGWLFEIAGRVGDEERSRVTTVLEKSFPNAVFRCQTPSAEAEAGRDIVFDVSDLVAYFARARVPTGIQRVQIEVIRALSNDPVPPRICCAIEGRDTWVEIPAEVFARITDIATAGDRFTADEWVEALASLQLALLLGDAIIFGTNAALLNLGTSWWLQNYFLQVRNARAESGIEYIPFVHDFIPIMAPEHCVDGLVEDFVFWATSVFMHANRFLVNSEATKSDLLRVAASLGHVVLPDAVTVVRLDARFEKPARLADVDATLEHFGIGSHPFALFVSTIESRKDHVSALRVWQRLLARHGAATPKLVCVGNDGWLNEQFYDLLASDPGLRDHVRLLTKISDAELGMLYEQCGFTIYPSTYEGWGLPITEALSYGKPVVAANNSSLPEAGGELAVYFVSGDLDAFEAQVEALSFDEAHHAAISNRIVREYCPRDWPQVARQIVGAATHAIPNSEPDLRVATGRWYGLSRSRSRTIWRGSGSAEVFRTGRGWADVDRTGAWIRADSASLMFEICDSLRVGTPLYLTIGLRAGASDVCYAVECEGCVIDAGTIGLGERRWTSHQLQVSDGRVKVDITCRPTNASTGSKPQHALCVEGFAVHGEWDGSTAIFMGAVTLDRLDQIAAYQEPFDASVGGCGSAGFVP